MASHELTPNAAHIREGREEWRGDALRKERDRDGERRKRSGSQVRQAQAKVLILALVIGGSQLLCLPGRVDEDEWAYEEHDATHGLRAQSIDGPTERCGGAGPLPHNAYRYRSSCSLSFPRSTVPFPEAVTWRSFGPRRSEWGRRAKESLVVLRRRKRAPRTSIRTSIPAAWRSGSRRRRQPIMAAAAFSSDLRCSWRCLPPSSSS